jgi:hypothetical protein
MFVLVYLAVSLVCALGLSAYAVWWWHNRRL